VARRPAAAADERAFAEWFWAQVDRSGGAGACWPWRGRPGPKGYGLVERREWRRDRQGRRYRVRTTHNASKVAWELAHGQRMPPGLKACHTCDNRLCCHASPAGGHIYAGTHQDNMDDMASRGRGRGPGLYGMAHPNARFSTDTIVEVRRRKAAGEPARTIALDLGMSVDYVREIARGERRVMG
jgi:hypothetical protein